MEEYLVNILNVEQVTHDVKRFTVEKPPDYTFIPGQATDVSINLPEMEGRQRPFTITCLNDEPYLEFTIKIYESHNGFTKELAKLDTGNQLIIREPFGTINYKGRGVFFAGGAGVTPFIAIFRELYKEGKSDSNKLFLSNKTVDDIILYDEFVKMAGSNFINILTEEIHPEFLNGRINEKFIRENVKDFNQYFYICGPGLFVKDIKNSLKSLGVPADKIVREK